MNKTAMEAMVGQWLKYLGEDPQREGLRQTPRRVVEAWAALTRGYQEDPDALIHSATFEVEANHMIIIKDIEIFSLCEHHLLPFFGRCHIGYIPKGRVIGVSKLARHGGFPVLLAGLDHQFVDLALMFQIDDPSQIVSALPE